MSEEKKVVSRALSLLRLKRGDLSNIMYYVYSCYEAYWTEEYYHDFAEFDNLVEAKQHVLKMELKEYVVTLIVGEELEV